LAKLSTMSSVLATVAPSSPRGRLRQLYRQRRGEHRLQDAAGGEGPPTSKKVRGVPPWSGLCFSPQDQ
jgi:hypothetical protein